VLDALSGLLCAWPWGVRDGLRGDPGKSKKLLSPPRVLMLPSSSKGEKGCPSLRGVWCGSACWCCARIEDDSGMPDPAGGS
jgi:hypothetical protein